MLRSEGHALSQKAKNEQAACIIKKKSKKDYYLNVKDVFDCGWLFSTGGKGITKDSLGCFSLEKKDTQDLTANKALKKQSHPANN